MDARGGEPNLRWFSLRIYFVRAPCSAVKNPIALIIVYASDELELVVPSA